MRHLPHPMASKYRLSGGKEVSINEQIPCQNGWLYGGLHHEGVTGPFGGEEGAKHFTSEQSQAISS